MARPANKLFDDDLVNELINYLKVGNYLGTACAAVGISEASYYRWMKEGLGVEDTVSGHPDEDDLRDRMIEGELVLGLTAIQVRSWNFRREVQKANALSEAYALAMVRTQMPTQWTAAMTFLERRFPSRWKRREQIDIGGEESSVGIDETLLLSDPGASKLIHEALALAAKGALPAGEDVTDAEVVPDDDKSPDA